MSPVSEGDSFFEGAEKLLEVWFSSSTVKETQPDLRNIPREAWEKLLELVKCEIISTISDDNMDAYLLSESSMYISQRRFILKTCGTTTLLLAVEPLLEMVSHHCGLDKVDDIFYSRKNFNQPDKQHAVHRTFDDEVEHLDSLFDGGAAYTLGRINRDCWYLYTIDYVGVIEPDQTLELLMWDMDSEKMSWFTKAVCETGAEASQKSGLRGIFPSAEIDDYMFDPCGYSMNALIPGGYYMTIHVTPEPDCSYVSFETNMPQKSYNNLIDSILHIFGPQKFLMTIFANQSSLAHETHLDIEQRDEMNGYTRLDHQYCRFKNYRLTYTHYARSVT